MFTLDRQKALRKLYRQFKKELEVRKDDIKLAVEKSKEVKNEWINSKISIFIQQKDGDIYEVYLKTASNLFYLLKDITFENAREFEKYSDKCEDYLFNWLTEELEYHLATYQKSADPGVQSCRYTINIFDLNSLETWLDENDYVAKNYFDESDFDDNGNLRLPKDGGIFWEDRDGLAIIHNSPDGRIDFHINPNGYIKIHGDSRGEEIDKTYDYLRIFEAIEYYNSVTKAGIPYVLSDFLD